MNTNEKMAKRECRKNINSKLTTASLLEISPQQKQALLNQKMGSATKRVKFNKNIDFSLDINHARVEAFKSILKSLKTKNKPLLYDLGCGPLIFSRIAVNCGHKVIAIDGRADRISPKALELVSKNSHVINLLQADMRKFRDFKEGSIICMLGSLYHLELHDQINLLKSFPEDCMLITDTQIHIPSMINKASCLEREICTDTISINGYQGMIFKETDNPMASIGNKTSFWHTPDSLERLFNNNGFSIITKYDPTYISKYGARSFYVSLR